MSSSSSKKRSFGDMLLSDSSAPCLGPRAVQMELDAVRAELEHERSVRVLEKRRWEQTQTRLQQKLELALKDAKEQKAASEETQQTSQLHMNQLRDSLKDALQKLRDSERKVASFTEEDGAIQLVQQEADMARERQQVLESKIDAMTEETESLRSRLALLQQDENEEIDKDDDDDSTQELFESSSKSGSLAPTAVLKELNRTRLALAESERQYRQLQRKSEDWRTKSFRFAQQQEAARTSATRIHQLETQLRADTKNMEALRAENRSWKEFTRSLNQSLGLTTLGPPGPTAAVSGGAGVPPETARIIRLLDTVRTEHKELQKEKELLQNQVQSCQKQISSLEQQVESTNTKLVQSKQQVETLDSRWKQSQFDVQSMRAQEGIWKREADSLRSLMKTYDREATTTKSVATDQAVSSSKGMETSLSHNNAAHDEIRLLTQERSRLSTQVQTLQTQQDELNLENSRIVERFQRLKEALVQEKKKAQDADARACQAEARAGKGHFDSEETRVLHLTQNPLTEAMQQRYEQEIRALKKQLGDNHKSNTSATTTSTTTPEVDPHKLHKRLKQSFKEQIGLFREGVYLMTGYKVDMLPSDHQRPTFRVRSMYAEQEQDHLLFVWPKQSNDNSGSEAPPTCLDLAETEQAKLLTKTDSYAYMTKFNSLPAFLASVQLSLFEKQTLV